MKSVTITLPVTAPCKVVLAPTEDGRVSARRAARRPRPLAGLHDAIGLRMVIEKVPAGCEPPKHAIIPKGAELHCPLCDRWLPYAGAGTFTCPVHGAFMRWEGRAMRWPKGEK